MRDILQLAGKLLLFTLIAGLLLGLTNAITEGPIAQQKLAAENASREALFPGAKEFTPMDLPGEPAGGIKAIYSAVDESGKTLGYTINSAVNGYKDVITLTTGISARGYLTGVIIDSQGETQGVGSKITTDSFLSQFTDLPASYGAITDGVDTITGATVSSSTVRNTVSAVADYTAGAFDITPKANNASSIDSAVSAAVPNATEFAYMNAINLLGDYGNVTDIYTAADGDELCGYIFELNAAYDGHNYGFTLGIDSAEDKLTALTPKSALPEAASEFAARYNGITAADAQALTAPEAGSLEAEIATAVEQAIDLYNTYIKGAQEVN